MWIFFILIWFIAFYRYLRKNTERIYSPIVWLLIGWFFSWGLYLFSGISYHYKLSFLAGAYYWGVCIAVVIGFRISQRWRIVIGTRQKIRLILKLDTLTMDSYRLYCGIVILGSILVVFDIMRLNTVSFNLHSDLNISGIGNIGILMSGLGLILWLYECVYAIKNNVRFRLVSIICAIGYLIPALITSGRQSILIMAVSSFVVLFYCFSKWPHYKHKAYIYVPIALAVFGLFVYTTIISASRTAVSNKIDLFNFMYKSSVSEETINLLEKMGPFRTIIMEILFYYSHELSMFEILFSNYDGPLFWGMSQLPLLARNIPVGNGKTIWDVLWTYYDGISNDADVYSHVWRSAAGNCLVDFGVVGGLIFAFIIGYIVGAFYKRSRLNDSVYSTVGLALICAGMLFAVQFSPICENYWLYPMIWWIFLPFAEKLFRREKRK